MLKSLEEKEIELNNYRNEFLKFQDRRLNNLNYETGNFMITTGDKQQYTNKKDQDLQITNEELLYLQSTTPNLNTK